MDRFTDWFDENSGYTLHQPHVRQLNGCCRDFLSAENLQIYFPGEDTPAPLLRCKRCGRRYAQTADGFVLIDSLLRYRVEKLPPQKI